MHVAHVFASHSWGGAEIYALELAARQSASGLQTSVWAPDSSVLAKNARARGLNVLTEPLAKRLDLLSIPRLARFIKDQGITHLHLHWSGGIWTFLGVKRWSKVHLTYHCHMWISHYKYDPFHWYAYRQLDKMIVAGERAKASAQKYLTVPARKISVLPYGVDLSRRPPASKARFPKAPFTFGLFARIDRQKGTWEFLDAIESLFSNENAQALIVGEPTRNEADADSFDREVSDRIANSPYRERIRRFSFRPDYLNLLNDCDVLVVPSYHESYSLIILDAYLCGIPVLATDSGGTPDLVAADRGWLVPPRDSQALLAAMKEILKNPEQVVRRGLAAREYVLSVHGFESVVQKLKSLYLE